MHLLGLKSIPIDTAQSGESNDVNLKRKRFDIFTKNTFLMAILSILAGMMQLRHRQNGTKMKVGVCFFIVAHSKRIVS